MKIIAIDPGYDRLGIAVLEKPKAGNPKLVFSECFTTDKKLPFEDRLLSLGNHFEKLITTHQPEALAIENLFLTKNQKTAMRVAEVRGALIFLAKKLQLKVFEFTPNEIKVAVTGYGKGSKKDIAFMVPKLIAVNVTKKIDDEVDAIAVGLTYFAHMKTTYPQEK
jgi:crossover junction endodeoxyribonuclease RuvC